MIMEDLRGTALAEHVIKVRTVTPLLMHGANPREMAESRETSFKGVIRYWWRVLQLNSSELLQEETRLFGGAGGREDGVSSPLRLRVSELKGQRSYAIRPHRGPSAGRTKGIDEGSTIELRMAVLRKDVDLLKFYKNLLEFAFSVGAFGQRARRGYGSLQIEDIKWATVEDYLSYLENLVFALTDLSFADLKIVSDVEHPFIRNLWVGEPCQTSKEALIKIGQASSDATASAGNVGYLLGSIGSRYSKRLASPLHASVRKIGADFYPIVVETRGKQQVFEDYRNQRSVFLEKLGVNLNE